MTVSAVLYDLPYGVRIPVRMIDGKFAMSKTAHAMQSAGRIHPADGLCRAPYRPGFFFPDINMNLRRGFAESILSEEVLPPPDSSTMTIRRRGAEEYIPSAPFHTPETAPSFTPHQIPICRWFTKLLKVITGNKTCKSYHKSPLLLHKRHGRDLYKYISHCQVCSC